LALERVYDIHSGNGLAASVLGVGHSIADNTFKEHLEYATGLFVDESRNALYATTASQTADSRLGDALDVVMKYLFVTDSAAFAKAFASFAASRQ